MTTFLILDDDDAIRESVQSILEDEGHLVTAFAKGDEALAYLRTHPVPHVILTDYLMPGMTGEEFLQHAHQEFAARSYAYVLMAARTPSRMPPTVQDVLTRWQIPFLQKPFELQELLDVIAACQP